MYRSDILQSGLRGAIRAALRHSQRTAPREGSTGSTVASDGSVQHWHGSHLAVLPPVLLETLGSQGMISEGSIIPLARALAGTPNAGVYAGALSSDASDSRAALALLILLASEDTQMILKGHGMAPP
jgi:hypothetical protein